MKKTFYFVRHGETEWNKIGRIQGTTDIPLSDVGVLQARKLAENLLDIPVSYIYSSPLKRAFMTADVISEKIGVEVKIAPLLREVCFGDAEGKIYSELPDNIKNSVNAIFDSGTDICLEDLVNAESFNDVFSRFMKFLDSVPDDENNVLLVSHGGVIKIALLKFLSEQVRIGNCACFAFEYDTISKNISNVRCV
ncbi:MAG: histidine phosphatase family protein [Alphaproteobacteria bacterium]|nr:histidine phosphatase family protein [Alphaproteobacteria bacterium]